MEVRARRLADLILCSLPCLQGRVGVGSLFVTEDQKPPSQPPPASRGRSEARPHSAAVLSPPGRREAKNGLARQLRSLPCLQGRVGVGSLFVTEDQKPPPPNLSLQAGGAKHSLTHQASPSSQREEQSCPRSPALLPSLTSSVGANTSSRMPTRCAPCIYGRRSRRECRQTRWRYCRRAKSLPSHRR